jgi:flavodoxin I
MPTLLIVYNTKTGNTELMAEAVEEGAKQVEGVTVTRTYHATPAQLEEADAVVIGAPTYNHRMTLDIQQLLEKAAKAEVNLGGKPAAAFGSYGWSGEAPENVLEVLRNRFNMNTIEPPVRSKYRPGEKTLKECRELGRKIAEQI